MDSLSEENEVPAFDQPAASSTPKKKKCDARPRMRMTCPRCQKSYVSEFYFQKHLLMHTDTVACSGAGGPEEVGGRNTNVFAIPSIPAHKINKKKGNLICTYCLKSYVCSRAFKKHVREHTLREAAAHFPKKERIEESACDIAAKAVINVTNLPSSGSRGLVYKQLLGHIASISTSIMWKSFTQSICMEMVKDIVKNKVLLPSSLINSLIDQVENIFNDYELCDGYMDTLQICDIFDGDVFSHFLLEFVLQLKSEIFNFIASTFRENLPRRHQLKTIAEPDKEDRQVIYYIAGSIFKGYLKNARRSAMSSTWQSVANVIKSKILVEKPSGDVDDSQWTQDVDRGRLLYVSEPCQRFFVALTKVVFECEKRNGSIDYETVISKVTNSILSVEWDSIIFDSLPEAVSLNLMYDVVTMYCRTCGRGFAKRRLNFLRSKPLVSMPTRHLVASRKNR